LEDILSSFVDTSRAYQEEYEMLGLEDKVDRCGVERKPIIKAVQAFNKLSA
jgi:hypothetical protein